MSLRDANSWNGYEHMRNRDEFVYDYYVAPLTDFRYAE